MQHRRDYACTHTGQIQFHEDAILDEFGEFEACSGNEGSLSES